MEQVFPAACGEDHAEAYVYALKEAEACGEPMLEQVLLTGTVAWGGHTMEQVILKVCSLWKETFYLEQVKSVRRKEK